MPNFLNGILRQSSGGLGGFLSGLGGSGGILTTLIAPAQARLAAVQAAGTAQAKVQALMGTLGSRLKNPGGFLGGLGGGGGGGTSSDSRMRYQASQAGIQRVYSQPTPPSGVTFR